MRNVVFFVGAALLASAGAARLPRIIDGTIVLAQQTSGPLQRLQASIERTT